MENACDICNNVENTEFHRGTPEHRMNYMLQDYQRNMPPLRSNRHGVELKIDVERVNGFNYDFTPEPDNKGRHHLNMTPDNFRSHGNQVQFNCRIKNGRTRRQDPIVITYAGVLHPFQPYSMVDPNNNVDHGKFVKLESGSFYSVKVKLKLDDNPMSNFKIPIYFSIQTMNESEEKMETFSLARAIIVYISDQVDETIAAEKSPFTSNKWEKVNSVPPTKRNRMILDEFPIPQRYWKTMIYGLKKDFGDGILQEILQKLEPGYVTLENYKDFFHILLWMEEVCAIIGLSCYNMENVNLQYLTSSTLQLEVPGLAEKRPSVIKGDFIEIKIHGDKKNSYQGIIQCVGDHTVNIEGLDEMIIDIIKNEPTLEIDVRFVLGRIHFERMHQGVEQVVLNGYVSQLFPCERLLSRNIVQYISLSEHDLFNKLVYRNHEQMTAVLKIINNTSKGAPYIVNGPPGTGKTVTIVEAIYHLMKQNKKILVCAPANAACNMLTEKLAAFCREDELKRVMTEACDTTSVHENIVKFCNVVKEDDEIVVTPFLKNNLKKFKVIVTTLVFAGKYSREYQPDVVFLDEAAQAREPEACCAIGLLMKSKQLVLAGDPKQLGPVVHSEICKEYKYDLSLLERLIQLPLYQNDEENNFTTMLKNNFRSHSEILKLPNELFYDNHLRAMSASAQSDPLARTNIYQLIINKERFNQNGSPVEFCSVIALEKREGRSPSYYNPREVEWVKKYVHKLTSLRFPQNPNMQIAPSEIGVVTPYIRQMYKIREALQPQYTDVEIGTTEAFQGREKKVIIISTVRAQHDLLLFDKKYKLGFVKEPKRFNVAITRAISKLIVVGNPLVLKTDDKWQRLIDQATRLGTKGGAPFPLRNRAEVEEITSRFRNFNMHDIKHRR